MLRKLLTRRELLFTGAMVFIPSIGFVTEPVAAQRRVRFPRRHVTPYQAWGPAYDRPFPLGQASDSFWETQQTNAEAADFIFHDHEFVKHSALLSPAGKQHVEQVALRLEHVPFPIVIERSQIAESPELDLARKHMLVTTLARMGIPHIEARIVIAPSFAEGITAIEAEQSYLRSLGTRNSNGGRIGGTGGTFR